MTKGLDVRIGINPISWSNDDLPSLGGETPLETALAEGKEIGYEGFELGNKFPKDGPGLKAKLDQFGLACVSGWYSGELANDSVEDAVGAEGVEAVVYDGREVFGLPFSWRDEGDDAADLAHHIGT